MSRLPNKVIHSRTQMLEDKRDELLRGLEVPAVVAGYKVFMTATGSGRCHYNTQTITVPKWAWSCPKTVKKVFKGTWKEEHLGDCWVYYLAHELAHACAGPKANHGPEFMKWFVKICPPELQHFELDYKPKLAAAAGIRK